MADEIKDVAEEQASEETPKKKIDWKRRRLPIIAALVVVATVIGVGVKSCTCSRWKSRRRVFTASSAMSISWQPGCDDMK